MKKFFRTLGLIVGVAFFSFLLNIFLGDTLEAHIANWSWVKRYGLVQPRAPLVINTTQEVRVSESEDVSSTIGKAKQRVTGVVEMTAGGPHLLGQAVAATADGIFLTPTPVVKDKALADLRLFTGDGHVGKVTAIGSDAVTGLSVLQAPDLKIPAASLSDIRDLEPGKRLAFVGINEIGSAYVLISTIAGAESWPAGVVSSDLFTAFLPLEPTTGLMPGQAAFDLNGRLAGVWNGDFLLSAKVMDNIMSRFLAGGSKSLALTNLGFYFRPVLPAERSAQLPPGLLVVAPAGSKTASLPEGRASKAGLQVGDVIIKINGEALEHFSGPADVLGVLQKPGQKLQLEIWRASWTINVTLP